VTIENSVRIQLETGSVIFDLNIDRTQEK